MQAGILQGQVKDMMVMDQWQASLMRALADMKLRTDPVAKQKVQENYSLSAEDEDEGLDDLGELVADDGTDEGLAGSGSSKRLSKRQKRRLQQRLQQQAKEQEESQQ